MFPQFSLYLAGNIVGSHIKSWMSMQAVSSPGGSWSCWG